MDFWSASFYTAVPEGSNPGPIPPWSIGNFEEVLTPLREIADANGMHALPIGIDEGRILAEPGGKLQLTGSRAVGYVVSYVGHLHPTHLSPPEV